MTAMSGLARASFHTAWVNLDGIGLSAPCPVYPDIDRTADMAGGPIRAHNRSHAPQQMALLFDHFVGSSEKRLRHRKAERLGGLEIDDQLGIGGLLDRRVSRLLAPENATRINAGEAISVREAGAVTH